VQAPACRRPAERGTNAIWNREGSLLTWLAAGDDAASLHLRVVSWDGDVQHDLAAFIFARDPAFPAGAFWWTDPGWRFSPLVWLPDNMRCWWRSLRRVCVAEAGRISCGAMVPHAS
jgi:hypothetical protein